MKKKNSLVFIIVCNLLCMLCFIIGFSMIKEEIPAKVDKNDFIKKMQEKGCSVTDLTNEKKYPGINNYLITDEETCNYTVTYVTFNNKKDFKSIYSNYKNDVLKNNPNARGSTSISINIFSIQYYEYTTNGDYYKSIIYSDNSILYASADKQYRDDIINIYKGLNYKYVMNNPGMILIVISILILLLIIVVSIWGIEEKIRGKGWIALIPYYNIGCLCKDILGSLWFLLLLLFPIGIYIFCILLFYKTGKVFNKKTFYCFLTILFPTFMCPLIAFDDSKYKKNNI